MKRFKALVYAALVLFPAAAYGYPNGTPMYVTDVAPFCASCHSAVRTDYMPELPQDLAKRETPEGKHYFLIKMPSQPSPYLELNTEQKEALIRNAQKIDENSSVSLSAPLKAKADEVITVTVKAKGGNGPVIGLMLVDRALRFQARPIQSEGWAITGEPEVKGQDGKIQKGWLDKRIQSLGRNLNYVNVEGQSYDPVKNIYPEGTVTFKLKAPAKPGKYTIAAAFLYGTENASSAGFFQRPSGRILFSEEVSVTVE